MCVGSTRAVCELLLRALLLLSFGANRFETVLVSCLRQLLVSFGGERCKAQAVLTMSSGREEVMTDDFSLHFIVQNEPSVVVAVPRNEV